MLSSLGLIAVGLALLTLGGDWLVRFAAALAEKLGVSRLVVGLTVVAFGTSAPELAVSVIGALTGKPDIAFGNVVGSNSFNVLAILGLAALVAPLAIPRRLFAIDLPIMILASLLLWAFAQDGLIHRADGLGMLLGLVGYMALQVRLSRDDPEPADELAVPPKRSLRAYIGLVAVSLAVLVVGSHLLVLGAVDFARACGLSELIIGLTIVAAGTSLPEVSASVAATLRGQREIAVGNVVGSNIFNIGAVLGLSSVVAPAGVSVAREALAVDLPVMVGTAILCLPIFVTGFRIARLEGILFLALYAAYVGFLVLAAHEHDALPVYTTTLTHIFLPLAGLAIGISLLRAWQQRREARASTPS